MKHAEDFKFSKNSYPMLPVEFFQTLESKQVPCSFAILEKRKLLTNTNYFTRSLIS